VYALHTITSIFFVVDTVNEQQFEVSCGTERNVSTGLITAIFEWTIIPPDLPFSPLEALNYLSINLNRAEYSNGTFRMIDFGRSVELQAPPGIKMKSIVDIGPKILPVITKLNEDASGSIVFQEIFQHHVVHARQIQVSVHEEVREILSFFIF